MPANQRRPPGDPPRRAVIDGRLAWIHYLFSEAAVMQVRLSRSASVGSVYRRVDTEFGGTRYIAWVHWMAQFRPSNSMLESDQTTQWD